MDRALAYLRVSTLAQEANGKNLESQLTEIKAYCTKQGYELHDDDIFRDVLSGARTDRAGYYKLLERVEHANAQVLIAYEVSRFGRNGTDNAWLLVKAKEYGFRIETVTGGRNFLADPDSEFMFDILSAVAKYERTAILYRLTRGKKAAHVRGRWVTGPAPIGYELTGNGGDKTLRPSQWAPIVTRAFELYAGGATLDATGRFLRANGVPGKWGPASVAVMLDNVTYRGFLRFMGDVVKGPHQTFVDADVWETVRRRRDRPGSNPRLEQVVSA